MKKAFFAVSGTGLLVPVRILETRKAYGRTDVLIAPIDGSGQAWVRDDKIVQTDHNEATKVYNEGE